MSPLKERTERPQTLDRRDEGRVALTTSWSVRLEHGCRLHLPGLRSNEFPRGARKWDGDVCVVDDGSLVVEEHTIEEGVVTTKFGKCSESFPPRSTRSVDAATIEVTCPPVSEESNG